MNNPCAPGLLTFQGDLSISVGIEDIEGVSDLENVQLHHFLADSAELQRLDELVQLQGAVVVGVKDSEHLRDVLVSFDVAVGAATEQVFLAGEKKSERPDKGTRRRKGMFCHDLIVNNHYLNLYSDLQLYFIIDI